MIRTTGFLLLLLTATCLAEWVYVGPNKQGRTLKYDANSVQHLSDRTRVKIHMEGTNGGYILSTVELLHRDLMVRNLDYRINGGAVRKVPKSHRLYEWQQMSSQSPMFQLWRSAHP